MPATPHIEQHFTASATIRDIVIGMSDGLTVPFALAAGLSGAVNSTAVVITAGLAEIAAGSIAMGLGGYLAAQTDAEHYGAELVRERREVDEVPDIEAKEVLDVFVEYGLTKEEAEPVVAKLRQDKQRWIDFMMRFELGLEAPDPARARISAATIAASYIVGGMIPLSPYIFMQNITAALPVSVIVTLIALFVFGFVKARLTGINPLRGGVQTTLIGGLAAAVAFGIARLIG